MADAGAAINIVGLDYGPEKFLHQVILLIGTTGRTDSGQAVRAKGFLVMFKLFGDEIVHLIPTNFFKMPVPLDHRRIQTIRVIVKFKCKTTLQAGVSLVHLGIVRGSNTEDFP